VSEYAVGLQASYFKAGQQFVRSGKPNKALTWYASGIRLLQEVLRKEPRHAEAKKYLYFSHWARAEALEKLDRYADSLKEWDAALHLENESRRAELRVNRAVTLARMNDYPQAAAEADELAADKTLKGKELYLLARVYSMCVQAVQRSTQSKLSEQENRAEQFAQRAMALLTRANAVGWFKVPLNVEHFKNDKDFDPLRSRDDFKKLLRELETKATPAKK
jgi:tetratricopeptide (TPR) repeat protein